MRKRDTKAALTPRKAKRDAHNSRVPKKKTLILFFFVCFFVWREETLLSSSPLDKKTERRSLTAFLESESTFKRESSGTKRRARDPRRGFAETAARLYQSAAACARRAAFFQARRSSLERERERERERVLSSDDPQQEHTRQHTHTQQEQPPFALFALCSRLFQNPNSSSAMSCEYFGAQNTSSAKVWCPSFDGEIWIESGVVTARSL